MEIDWSNAPFYAIATYSILITLLNVLGLIKYNKKQDNSHLSEITIIIRDTMRTQALSIKDTRDAIIEMSTTVTKIATYMKQESRYNNEFHNNINNSIENINNKLEKINKRTKKS